MPSPAGPTPSARRPCCSSSTDNWPAAGGSRQTSSRRRAARTCARCRTPSRLARDRAAPSREWQPSRQRRQRSEDERPMLRTAGDDAPPLLGRAEEQELLTSLLDGVAKRGQALVLRGEPGIGKSRLLSEAARMSRERGMTVLTTTGVQSEAHLPFAGLHQL